MQQSKHLKIGVLDTDICHLFVILLIPSQWSLDNNYGYEGQVGHHPHASQAGQDHS